MAANPSPTASAGRSPVNRLGIARRMMWPLAFTILILLTFSFYKFLLPALNDNAQTFVNTWFSASSINEALIWVICALGLNVVVGYAGLLDLGFVAFWAFGGYTAGWLMSSFEAGNFPHLKVNVLGSPVVGQEGGIHLSFWLVLVAAGVLCAFAGVLIGAPTLRLRSDYLALVTLGFGEIIPQFFTNGEDIGGFNLSNGSKGITPIDPINIGYKRLGPFDLSEKFLIFSLLAALIVFVSLRLRAGRLGRAWLAIREDELAASAMGVPLMRTKLAAYAVGAVAGGLGGAAFATHVNGVLSERFNFSISITLLAMVVLGGMGNVWGVILGSLVLAWVNSTGLPQAGNAINGTFGTQINFSAYNYLLFGGVLVIMMLFRREGLLPESRTRLILREPSRTELVSAGTDLEQAAPELDDALGPVSPAGPVHPLGLDKGSSG